MRTFRGAATCLVLLAAIARPARADCPVGQNWIQSWTDAYGQTTYTLEAPCEVFIGVPFQITATVTDATHPNDTVGWGWSLVDNGAVIAGGGFNWIDLVNGQWQFVYTQTYEGNPVNHTLQFWFHDLGQGTGAHSWAGQIIGAVTVDPYPDSPPVATPSGGGTYEVGTPVTLGGTVADTDGDTLQYAWLDGTDVLSSGTIATQAGSVPVALPPLALPPLPVGVHTFVLRVSDATHTVDADVVVTVIDVVPPTLAPVATPDTLWPPQGQLVDVTVVANAADDSGGPVRVSASVLCSDALAEGDATVVGIDQTTGVVLLSLRAARPGGSAGRVYTVVVTGTDPSGNTASASVDVLVPHDEGRR